MANILVPRGQIVSQLQAAFSGVEDEAIVLHSDLMEIGIIDRVKAREQLLSDYWSVIKEVIGERCLLIPTFNYGFCRHGLYDVEHAPSEVGVLNEYIRQISPELRTRTPVFNFSILNNKSFSFSAVENPFSVESTFGEVAAKRARVVFFGARFDANTFIHHVEEVMDVGYRYIKPFPGEIIEPGGSRRTITLRYRVRPLDGSLVYDWERLEAELKTEGILHEFPLGNGYLMHYRADHLLDHWCAKLKESEMFLLTPESRGHMSEMFEKFGYPLIYKEIEAES